MIGGRAAVAKVEFVATGSIANAAIDAVVTRSSCVALDKLRVSSTDKSLAPSAKEMPLHTPSPVLRANGATLGALTHADLKRSVPVGYIGVGDAVLD